MARKKPKEHKLKCPNCQNPNLLVITDFSDKRTNTSTAFCVKKEVKNILGITKTIGCGQSFKITITKESKIKFDL